MTPTAPGASGGGRPVRRPVDRIELGVPIALAAAEPRTSAARGEAGRSVQRPAAEPDNTTSCSRPRPPLAGFSLIEALVALAILAAVGGSATALFGMAGERDARATARLRAVIAAESLLARVGLDIPARPGRRRGRLADGAAWEIVIAPPREPGLEGGETVLYAVTVRVAPSRGEPVVLESLTLDRGPF